MKALIRNEILELKNVSFPQLKENEVLIKVKLAGICRTDQYVGDGTIKIDNPIIIGHEFCGFIASDNSHFKIGELVTVNPLLEDYSFVGINHNGCFAEYIAIDQKQVYKIETSNYKLAAYIEPIAASLAPLKANLQGLIHIYGTNRIAQLTALVLELSGYECKLIAPNSLPDNSCDTIIETMMDEDSIEQITNLLKPNGTLVLKSRFPNKILVNLHNFVKKDICIKSVYYYDFQKSIEFALKNEKLFNGILGSTHKIEQYKKAFNESLVANKKVFFEF